MCTANNSLPAKTLNTWQHWILHTRSFSYCFMLFPLHKIIRFPFIGIREYCCNAHVLQCKIYRRFCCVRLACCQMLIYLLLPSSMPFAARRLSSPLTNVFTDVLCPCVCLNACLMCVSSSDSVKINTIFDINIDGNTNLFENKMKINKLGYDYRILA